MPRSSRHRCWKRVPIPDAPLLPIKPLLLHLRRDRGGLERAHLGLGDPWRRCCSCSLCCAAVSTACCTAPLLHRSGRGTGRALARGLRRTRLGRTARRLALLLLALLGFLFEALLLVLLALRVGLGRASRRLGLVDRQLGGGGAGAGFLCLALTLGIAVARASAARRSRSASARSRCSLCSICAALDGTGTDTVERRSGVKAPGSGAWVLGSGSGAGNESGVRGSVLVTPSESLGRISGV